jgi:putative DNA primase/helicase
VMLRPLFDHVPAFLFDSNDAGAGKGYNVEAHSLISSGRIEGMRPAPRDTSGEEMRKALTGILLEGAPVTVFDNLETAIEGEYLSLVLTTDVWKDRLLGANRELSLPVRTVFAFTGINIQIGGDMWRRVVACRLIKEKSTLHERRRFKYEDLHSEIRRRRPRLLAAYLTLCRAWFVAGRPPADVTPMPSFVAWARTIGGVLAHAGVKGFLGNRQEFLRMSNPSAAAWEGYLRAIYGKFGEREFTTSMLVKAMNDNASLRDLLPEEDDFLDDEGTLNRRKLGRAFLRRNGTPFGEDGIRIEACHDAAVKKAAAKWRLRKAAA